MKRLRFVVMMGLVMLAACGMDPEQEPAGLRQPLDDALLTRLRALPGVTVTEVASPPSTRGFQLSFTQPVDHGRPAGAQFQQRALLLHRDVHQPVVLASTGYGLFSPRPRDTEISYILSGNSLIVEHRYFEGSVPHPTDYRYLTIRQAAQDHHRIVQLLRPIYAARWISTGGSKGGMTSLYHRRFFPGDVDGTVAYVAPQSYGTSDLRYPLFLERVGSGACRQRILDFQRAALARRDELLPLFQEQAAELGLTYRRVGGLEVAFEHGVQELRFALWQYADESYCATLPAPDAPAADLQATLDEVSGPAELASDQSLAAFGSYYYQAAAQLGSYGPLELHLRRELEHPGTYRVERYSPAPVARFDSLAMPEVQTWLALFGRQIMLVYGQNDPWSAGAFELGGAADSFRYFVPAGNHGSSLFMLPPAEKDQAYDALARWTGVTPTALQRLSQEALRAGATAAPADWLRDRRPRRASKME